MPFDPLFDQEKCPVQYVPKVDFLFIDDCNIQPAPDPVFDCLDIEIPPEPPLPPITVPPLPLPSLCIPCPTIHASATLTVGCAPPSVDVTVTTTHSTGSCDPSPSCAFVFDFDFNIPKPPCPVIAASAGITVVEGDSAGVDITVTPVTTATSDSCQSTGCDLIFDFDFRIPLPSLSVSLPSTSVSFPCPTFNVSATAGFANEPEVNFTIEPTGSNSCAFNVTLEVLFPSTSASLPSARCPEFTATADIAFGDSLAADFIVTRDTEQPGNCAFNLDLDIVIPCATISQGSATVELGDEPSIDFTITPTGGPGCGAIVDLHVVVPTPVPGPAGGDGPPGNDGNDGRDCNYGCYGGYAYCQLWIWCPPCAGSDDGGSWKKPSGTNWTLGDPPYPTYDGNFEGDATITCFCPPCLSSSSLSSVSSSSAEDTVDAVCCPDPVPATLYCLVDSDVCPEFGIYPMALTYNPALDRWQSPLIAWCPDTESLVARVTLYCLSVDNWQLQLRLADEEVINYGTIFSLQCSPFELAGRFGNFFSPSCCNTPPQSAPRYANVYISA